jgi:UDP-GlcNAc:undecaprenyl-phosphate GlcNAc-1-phosphate transferase
MKTYLLLIFQLLNIFLIISYRKYISTKLKLYKTQNKKIINSTPLIGGLILFSSLIINYIFFYNELIYFNMFIIITSIIFFIGLMDDIISLPYQLRLLPIYLLLILFVYYFEPINLKYLYFETINKKIFLNVSNFFFTPLFILILLHALNLFDGINGLVSIYYLIISSLIFFFSSKTNFDFFILINLLAIIIFIFFNLNNKIYLGDSGVYVISAMLSMYIIYNYNLENPLVSSCEKIFLILMMPGIDMIRLIFERILKKKNPFKADYNHLHHLLDRKFGPTKSLIICLVLSFWSLLLIFKIKLILLILANILVYINLLYYLKKTDGYKKS